VIYLHRNVILYLINHSHRAQICRFVKATISHLQSINFTIITMTKRKAPNTTATVEPPLKTRRRQLETEVQPGEPLHSSPSTVLSLGTELDTSLRVLRAVEEIGTTGWGHSPNEGRFYGPTLSVLKALTVAGSSMLPEGVGGFGSAGRPGRAGALLG
jgi:hypothetical protein